MHSWFAAHWTPDDLPGLEVVITQYDAHRRNAAPKANDATAVVRLMDTYGITPAGQQARRWQAPKEQVEIVSSKPQAGPYASLRVVKTA